MARLSWVALLAAASFVISDAFVSPRARWAPTSMSARQGRQRSFTARTTPRFLTPTTARKASGSDDGTAEAPPESKPAAPEDLDYYEGLLGQQPAADKAVMVGGNGEAASTNDYPIPLPSYLLLALATVVSIAFFGCIFEVIGGNPELGYPATYVIGTLSLPGFIFLFYAAIKKGKAEVEEDDAEYGKGRW